MRILAVVILCFAVLITPVQAQVDSDSFSIRLFGFDDDVAPTTPNLLSVTPVSSTQLDVDWSASTDNRILSGYVLTRDGLPIATTTLTSFSDTGLTASTTYTYTVQAFDAAGNYSSSSNSISGTTPDIPPPVVATTTDSAGADATSVRVVLDNFKIDTTDTEATFLLEAARPARITISWGRTVDYELGYLQNDSFVRSHSTTITDLEPGTVYEYEIIGHTPSGYSTVLKRGQFTTNGGVVPVLGNVQRLRATVEQSDVRLNWELPETSGLANIRIVRSHLGFPQNLLDGAIVYQGQGTTFFDKGVLEQFSPVYYTVFTIDQHGNTSSGAVVSAAIQTSGEGVIYDPVKTPDRPPIEITDEIEIFDEQATTSPDISNASSSEQLRIPSLEEIFIQQAGKQYSFNDTQIVLKSDQQYVVSIPHHAVMKNLKTILVSFTDPVDPNQTYSYILRLNKDQTAYEAVINPFGVVGESNFTVAVYDYESRIVSRYFKQVEFTAPEVTKKPVLFPDYFLAHIEFVFGGLILICLLLWWLGRRKQE